MLKPRSRNGCVTTNLLTYNRRRTKLKQDKDWLGHLDGLASLCQQPRHGVNAEGAQAATVVVGRECLRGSRMEVHVAWSLAIGGLRGENLHADILRIFSNLKEVESIVAIIRLADRQKIAILTEKNKQIRYFSSIQSIAQSQNEDNKGILYKRNNVTHIIDGITDDNCMTIDGCLNDAKSCNRCIGLQPLLL